MSYQEPNRLPTGPPTGPPTRSTSGSNVFVTIAKWVGGGFIAITALGFTLGALGYGEKDDATGTTTQAPTTAAAAKTDAQVQLAPTQPASTTAPVRQPTQAPAPVQLQTTATPTPQPTAVPPTPRPEPTSTPNATPVPRGTYFIDWSVSEDAYTLRVAGTTNLPDGGVLVISASVSVDGESAGDRLFYKTQLDSAETIITAGSFSAALDTSEPSSILGSEPVYRIDDSITVCVSFLNGRLGDERRQPDLVRDVVGDFGEALEGSPGVTLAGTSTPNPAFWLELGDAFLAENNGAHDTVPEAQVERLDRFCTGELF